MLLLLFVPRTLLGHWHCDYLTSPHWQFESPAHSCEHPKGPGSNKCKSSPKLPDNLVTLARTPSPQDDSQLGELLVASSQNATSPSGISSSYWRKLYFARLSLQTQIDYYHRGHPLSAPVMHNAPGKFQHMHIHQLGPEEAFQRFFPQYCEKN